MLRTIITSFALLPAFASASERIYFSDFPRSVYLGSGIGGAEVRALCLKGSESILDLTPQTIYRLRTSKYSDSQSLVFAEMVIISGVQSLSNFKLNVPFKPGSREFAERCGSAFAARIYRGLRLSYTYLYRTDEAQKVQPLELIENGDSTLRTFTEAVAEQLKTVHSLTGVGFEVTGYLKGPHFSDFGVPQEGLFREFKQKALNPQEIRPGSIEADAEPYSPRVN